MSDNSLRVWSNRRATKIIAGIVISVFLISIWTILFLPNATETKIELTIVGEDTKTIKPGEAVLYPIRVENKGNVREDIRFETLGTPEGWQSELDIEKLNLDSGALDYVLLAVKSPSVGTRGPPVATIGVRALIGTGQEGTKNQTLIETITWSFNYDKIKEKLELGDYTKPTRIETTADSAVVYKLPNSITVKHVDQSNNETYKGKTFWRNITVPVDVSIIISTDTIFEMGYVGSYNYSNREKIEGQEGNPIQNTVELRENIIKGTVYIAVKEREGTGGLKKDPLIEVLLNEGNASVERLGIIIPVMNTVGGIFSTGLSEKGTVDVEVYNGFVDFEVRKFGEKEPFISITIGQTPNGAPQGVSIDKFDEKVKADVIDKNVVIINGDVEVLNDKASPPIEISPTEKMIFLDLDGINEFTIKGNETYKIEIKKYKKGDNIETISIEDIEPGGYDIYIINEDSFEIKTTSTSDKTVAITIEKDGKTYSVELPLTYKNNEEYILKDIDMDNGTSTILITTDDGKGIELKDIPSGIDSEGVIKEREKEEESGDDEDEDTDYVCILIFLLVILLMLLFTINYWYRKKGKNEDKDVKELMRKNEEDEIPEEKEPVEEEEAGDEGKVDKLLGEKEEETT